MSSTNDTVVPAHVETACGTLARVGALADLPGTALTDLEPLLGQSPGNCHLSWTPIDA
ncbi:hypothetical protein ACWC3X_32620 [Streptomyces populi]